MYQQFVGIGNLGNAPELRYTPAGVPVATFSMAVNKSWTDESGAKHDKTVWFRVTAWRKLGELAAQYLEKGRQVLVVGELEDARAYTDKEGNLRASLEVTAQTIKFLGGAGNGNNGSSQPVQASGDDSSQIPF